MTVPLHQFSRVVIFNPEQDVLLLQRSPNSKRRELEWDVPGGFVRPDEGFERGARREVREESGIELSRLVLGHEISYNRPDRSADTVTRFYLSRTPSSDVNLNRFGPNHEHIDAKWVPPEHALRELKDYVQCTAFEYMLRQGIIASFLNDVPW